MIILNNAPYFFFNLSGIKIALGVNHIVSIVLCLSDINLPMLPGYETETHINNTKLNSTLCAVLQNVYLLGPIL